MCDVMRVRTFMYILVVVLWERCRDTLHKGITPHPNPLPFEHVVP